MPWDPAMRTRSPTPVSTSGPSVACLVPPRARISPCASAVPWVQAS
ncbi:hypothetical protein BJY54_005006 [Streptomyces nodosus]|nr:hypothetical protein [Streptomyces nodosus]